MLFNTQAQRARAAGLWNATEASSRDSLQPAGSAISRLAPLVIVSVLPEHDKNSDDIEEKAEKKPKPRLATGVLCPQRTEGSADKHGDTDSFLARNSVLQT